MCFCLLLLNSFESKQGHGDGTVVLDNDAPAFWQIHLVNGWVQTCQVPLLV